jgi:hypothetical protein
LTILLGSNTIEVSKQIKDMNETASESASEYKPDFVFGGNRKISEENWLEYEAQGVHNLVESMSEEDEEALREELARDGYYYGTENLLLGDAFDVESGRPLRLKPGIGIYVTAQGREHYRQHFDESTSVQTAPVMILPDGTHIVAKKGVNSAGIQHKQ